MRRDSPLPNPQMWGQVCPVAICYATLVHILGLKRAAQMAKYGAAEALCAHRVCGGCLGRDKAPRVGTHLAPGNASPLVTLCLTGLRWPSPSPPRWGIAPTGCTHTHTIEWHNRRDIKNNFGFASVSREWVRCSCQCVGMVSMALWLWGPSGGLAMFES